MDDSPDIESSAFTYKSNLIMESRLLGETSRVFANADPYCVSDYVNQHVGLHSIQLPRRGQPSAALSHREFGNLDLCRIRYGAGVHVTSPALETVFHLQILLQGNCLWRGKSEQHHFRPGELLLINPDDPVDLTYSDDCEKFIIKVPAAFLDKACTENNWRRPAEGIRFAARHDMNQLDGFINLLTMICHEAEGDQSMPMVREQYTRIVASKLLGLLSNNVSREELSESCPSFERVAQYIDENLKQDISIDQLAQAVRISPRSLYALFDRNAGTTPKNYIRARKLERVRECLCDPAARVRNVTEVALDYGFMHLGRFSENYKGAFGELPSETLRRR